MKCGTRCASAGMALVLSLVVCSHSQYVQPGSVQVGGPGGLQMMVPFAYDCQMDIMSWETTWDSKKKAYCCLKEGHGCKPYDCLMDLAQREEKWNAAKKTYCCKTSALGCIRDTTTTTTLFTYDCEAGKHAWEQGWSEGKKGFCCSRTGISCDPYDCKQNAEASGAAWTLTKRSWCCDKTGEGCTQTTFKGYDCQAGKENWEHGWSVGKKVYCCQTLNMACDPFDCDAGIPEGWSNKKLQFCCANKNKGCHTTDGPVHFDCQAGKANWKAGWNDRKKNYCCGVGGTECQDFDCSAGLSNWMQAWSDAKKGWCCKNKNLGCTGIIQFAFDCVQDSDAWEQWVPDKKAACCKSSGTACEKFDCRNPEAGAGAALAWSDDKQVWCCDSKGVACSTSVPQFDCEQGADKWEAGWSNGKKTYCCKASGTACDLYNCAEGDAASWQMNKTKWCCEAKGQGCPGVDDTFDCTEGADNWRTGWSDTKKSYCCGSGKVVCDAYDCKAQLDTAAMWPVSQRAWCCMNKGLGCLTTTTTILPLYDCETGKATWERWGDSQKSYCCLAVGLSCDPYDCSQTDASAWSPSKQSWCCSERGTGCTTSPAVTYDCDAGYANWETGWSTAKKQYCCNTANKACDPFDCRGEADSWATTKKSYCCDNSGVGCRVTAALYNCSAGVVNWEKGWSSGKKMYCCQHTGTACDPYDCTQGLEVQVSVGSASDPNHAQKAAWCCSTKGQGCLTTSVLPFNCSSGTKRWTTAWSTRKKTFCCNVMKLPCEPFDCKAGIPNGWAHEKIQWCCVNKGEGCTTTLGMAGFDCQAGLDNWKAGWNKNKKRFCCDSGKVDCDVFNCDEAYDNWQLAWPQNKKAWCCKFKKRGCPESTSYNCKENFTSWEAWTGGKKFYCCKMERKACDPYDCGQNQASVDKWPVEKQSYCCDKVSIGCLTTSRLPHDCFQNADKWESTWPLQKKTWCCRHGGAACEPYHCTEGHLSDWIDTKTEWCCANKQIGCKVDTGFDCQKDADKWDSVWTQEQQSYCCDYGAARCDVFDCSAGAANWQAGWSEAKKSSCCASTGVGCPPTTAPVYDFNCDDQLQSFDTMWSDEKKGWCCQQYGKGCGKFNCNVGSSVRDWCIPRLEWCCTHEQQGCDDLQARRQQEGMSFGTANPQLYPQQKFSGQPPVAAFADEAEPLGRRGLSAGALASVAAATSALALVAIYFRRGVPNAPQHTREQFESEARGLL